MYLDIETSAKNANEGIVIAIGILPEGGQAEVRFASNLEEEKKALEWLKEKLKSCDEMVTWFGSGFDIPFLITRAIYHNIDMSELAEIPMLDLCKWSQANLSMSSHSLEAVARFFGISEGKEFRGTDILTLFRLVERGDFESRKLIVDHCREDVVVLKRIHDRLRPAVDRSRGRFR
ncbi:MAG: ribonuclease H-like domain-containing protein [Candidatus Hadarchaeota archaeon]